MKAAHTYLDSYAEPFQDLTRPDLNGLLERIGDCRIVLIGEASHGTSEFYQMRQRITWELIREKGFNMIGIEGDWPDTEHVDAYVRLTSERPGRPRQAFSRFPTWMWRNQEVLGFIEWLKKHNTMIENDSDRVHLYGLDLYSLYRSIHEVIEYFDRQGDHELSRISRARYSTLLAYEPEPQNYGSAVFREREQTQERQVAAMLRELLEERLSAADHTQKNRVFDAEQNARVVANAETYYRTMFRGGHSSWNQRDRHMFETLQNLLNLHGKKGKMVVWAHNTHVGDARATGMKDRGELNIGQLCTEHFADDAYRIGFGTHAGTVAAADNWGEPVKIKQVNPSAEESHERICHDSGKDSFILPLRPARREGIWTDPLLERAIGVIYRPDTERVSHYFDAVLPDQFDEYIWFDQSQAVTPLEGTHAPKLPAQHPFLLVD